MEKTEEVKETAGGEDRGGEGDSRWRPRWRQEAAERTEHQLVLPD